MEVWAPVITPFDADGSLDLEGYIENLHTLKSWNLTGAVLMGSTGEFPHLGFEERRAIIREAGKAGLTDFPLLVHAGGLPFHLTAQLVEDTVKWNLTGALVITPYYFVSNLTEEALTTYYQKLMDIGPIYLYHYPAQTGVTLRPEWVAAMAEAGLRGIKDTSGQAAFMARLTALAPARFKIYGGLGGSLLQALAAGAHGGIVAVSLFAPKACLDLVKAFREGRIGEAQVLARQLAVLESTIVGQHGPAGTKWAAAKMGLRAGPPRLPLLPLDDEATGELRALLKDRGELRRRGAVEPA